MSHLHFTRRHMLAVGVATGLAAGIAPHTALARKLDYMLDATQSEVSFAFLLSGVRQRGTMPVQRADIQVNPLDLAASTVDVELNVAKARTGLIFATQAMTGPDVLHAKQHPTIRFKSRKVTLGKGGRISNGATIAGDVSIRDVVRPLTLQASLFRKPGSAPDDLSELIVNLTGSVQRSQFGAGGYADLVDDEVTLDIRAVIRVTE